MRSKKGKEQAMTSQPRMATAGECRTCEQPIRWGSGCIGPEVTASILDKEAVLRLKAAGQKNAKLPRIRVRRYRSVRPSSDLYQHGDRYCGDCGAGLGQYHHMGCDLEVCPGCGQQAYFGCECGR